MLLVEFTCRTFSCTESRCFSSAVRCPTTSTITSQVNWSDTVMNKCSSSRRHATGMISETFKCASDGQAGGAWVPRQTDCIDGIKISTVSQYAITFLGGHQRPSVSCIIACSKTLMALITAIYYYVFLGGL